MVFFRKKKNISGLLFFHQAASSLRTDFGSERERGNDRSEAIWVQAQRGVGEGGDGHLAPEREDDSATWGQ